MMLYYIARQKPFTLLGYIKINGANVKIVQANNADDLKCFAEREGFKLEYKEPLANLFTLTKRDWRNDR